MAMNSVEDPRRFAEENVALLRQAQGKLNAMHLDREPPICGQDMHGCVFSADQQHTFEEQMKPEHLSSLLAALGDDV